MTITMPRRLIGYGAWNLVFDKLRGATPATDNLTFMSYLRALNYFAVNHIKVILFRKSTIEGLPSDRAMTLFKEDGGLNLAVIENLKILVNEAAQKGFTIQICIWHHHALATSDKSEYPENAPAVFAPDWSENSTGRRLAKYFAPSTARQAAFAAHRELFYQIAREFGDCENVIWELGNELRVWQSNPVPGPDATQQQKDLYEEKLGDERNLRAWLADMLTVVRQACRNPIPVCTSTAVDNEYMMFKQTPGLDVDFYDFHSGQWNMTDKFDNDYPVGIRQSRERVQMYNPGAKLIINTDGLFRGESFQTSGNFAAFMEKWAIEAFRRGESFVTKGYYPPGVSISRPMLDALELANRAVPLT